MEITHAFVSEVDDDPAASAAGAVLPSHWNAAHSFSGALPYANLPTGMSFDGTLLSIPNLIATAATADQVPGKFKAHAGQTANVLEIQDSEGTFLSGFYKQGGFKPVAMADGVSQNDVVYYSTTTNKLCYKTPGGTVVPLQNERWNLYVKPSDESRSSNAVLADDSYFSIPIASGTKYLINGWIFFTQASSAADMRYRINTPSSPSFCLIRSVGYAPGSNGGVTTNQFDENSAGTGSARTIQGITGSGMIQIHGTIQTAASGGNLVLQWCQGTSDAGALVVKAGSYIEVTQF